MLNYHKVYDKVYGIKEKGTFFDELFSLGWKKDFNVLYDIGAGTGRLTRDALNFFEKIYAVEIFVKLL